MTAWVYVAVAALVACVATGCALRMWRQRNHWRQRQHATELVSRDVQEQFDQQRGALTLAAAAAAVGRQLRAPLGLLRTQRSAADDLARRYHELINQYDDAVRYCLQPVELLPAADEFTLERLVQHVGDARRKLFTARTALLDSHIPQLLDERLARGDEAADQVDRLAAALCHFDDDAADGDDVDVNELVSAALILTRTRLPASVRVIRRLEAVPALPRVPWLAPILLQLLQVAADNAGRNGRLIARTQLVNRHVEVHIIGHASLSSTDTRERRTEDLRQTLHALHYRLAGYGASIDLMPLSGHGQGLVLCLPVRAQALAA